MHVPFPFFPVSVSLLPFLSLVGLHVWSSTESFVLAPSLCSPLSGLALLTFLVGRLEGMNCPQTVVI